MRSSLIAFITVITLCVLTGCAPQSEDDATVTATPHPRTPPASVAATMISPVTH